MGQTQVALDKRVLEVLGDTAEQIERGAIEANVLDLYRRRQISVGRAAEILGLDQLSFIRWSGALGVPFFDMTPEEWQRELRTIESM